MIPLLITAWVMGMLYIWTRKDYTVCPKCGADTMEQGYEGIRRKCSNCDWSNNGS